MNEVLMHNLFGTFQWQMILIVSMFMLTLGIILIGGDIVNTKTKNERKAELFVRRVASIFTILLILDTILFFKYSKQPSIDNPKYYTV